MACAGVMPPRVLRGRSLSSVATSRSRWGECTDRSVPLGKCWRSKPVRVLVGPPLPRAVRVAEVDDASVACAELGIGGVQGEDMNAVETLMTCTM